MKPNENGRLGNIARFPARLQERLAGTRLIRAAGIEGDEAGEVTVAVSREATGTGGRNQHFALLASKLIAADSITVLSAGSDGIDGNTPAAGAVVDGETLARAARGGYPVDAAISAFDSYSLLSLLEDAITTGPTGNNLRDLRVLLAS